MSGLGDTARFICIDLDLITRYEMFIPRENKTYRELSLSSERIRPLGHPFTLKRTSKRGVGPVFPDPSLRPRNTKKHHLDLQWKEGLTPKTGVSNLRSSDPRNSNRCVHPTTCCRTGGLTWRVRRTGYRVQGLRTGCSSCYSREPGAYRRYSRTGNHPCPLVDPSVPPRRTKLSSPDPLLRHRTSDERRGLKVRASLRRLQICYPVVTRTES